MGVLFKCVRSCHMKDGHDFFCSAQLYGKNNNFLKLQESKFQLNIKNVKKTS